MEEKYRDSFFESGKVTDYLYYKGLGICKQVMERCESGDYRVDGLMNAVWTGGKSSESDYANRNGAASGTDR